ncbi:MAG TPA: PQQ-dependent sugar dehydrogenase, partial [Humisphaera sp.]|nr:PQQ-dependent sugar dehydrogenase [Humisphaera sp.]
MLPLLTLRLARRRCVLKCVLVILCLAGVLIAISQQRRATAAALEKRVPWTSGHVTGTPEPPPAFVLHREFPKLTFEKPTEIVFEPGTNRMFISEQPGKIFSFPTNGDPQTADLVIDMRQAITDIRGAPGARGFDSVYGLAFHPNYRQNHQIYICYALSFLRRSTDPVGTRVARFTVGGDPPRIDPASGKTLIEWQAGGHNGGCLRFGKDGYLYISAGDQADPDPPDLYNTGQDISDLRSSILRIDVDHADGDKPYSIPRDNPFVNLPGARGEVWCYGLRNPWRFSIDRATGNVWIGDVG